MKRVIVFTFIALYTMCVYSQEAKIDGITYKVISPTEAEVYRGDKSATEFMISEYVTIKNKKYKVTTIRSCAFEECTNLTSITIPNSVTTIGSSAFKLCTNLTSITIPNSVTTIGSEAFSGWYAVTSITVDANNPKYDSRDNCNAIIETATNTLIAGCKNTVIPNSVTTIGDNAFSYCINLTSITIPNSVTTIGSSAFKECINLKSITIPNSVTTIGDWAFLDCYAVTSITIPNSVTTIGTWAFLGCDAVTSITVDANNPKYDSRDNCNAIIETATNTLITGCKNTVIPNTVTTIGDNAFSCCETLTSITIPNSVTTIGEYAFSYCEALTSITIPNSVTTIEERAFYGCESLTSITIPNSVTTIGYAAFEECINLKSITIPNSVTTIGIFAFCNCEALTSITIPNSVTTIGHSAFSGCEALTSITIPNSVTTIGEYAFSGCEALTSITIPNSVTTIGKNVFNDCSSLKSIRGNNYTIPKWLIEYAKYDSNLSRSIAETKRTFSYFAYDRIIKLLQEWQQKREYETTAQWQVRVTEETRAEQLKKIQKQLLAEYIEQQKPKTIKSSIGNYDADYGVFPIKVDNMGTFYLQVPIAEAPKVKEKWHKAKIFPTYGIVEDRLAITSAEVNVNGKKYKTDDKYETPPEIAINLPPLQINLDNGITKKDDTATPAAIDNSIDINIPTNSSNNANTFAVIIGNEDYQQVSKVQYAKNDAKIFATYCEKTLGLPKKNIKLYQDATFGIMMSAVENIQNIAKAFKGDINIIFYYAGHGVPNESTNEAFLLPVDAKGNNTTICYSINKLLKELKEINANSVTVFMDACFSGAQRGEGMLASARGVAIKAKKVEPQGNMVVFSAASADETAYPYKEKGHGLFTYFLLKKLNETKGDVTLGELGDYISEKVAQESVVSNGKSQTPTVTVSQAVSDSWRNCKLR